MEGYMGELTTTQQSSLHTIIDAANRMNELISTLLNVTRIESGTIALSPKSTNVNRLCEEVVKDHTVQAQNKAVALVCKFPPKPLLIRTDNLIVKEILGNLVSNAIKYTTNQGTVTISIRDRKDSVLFSVHDTGMGIPSAAREQVFTKFFRGANAVKQETTGTGLGLYLVKGLTERLGGKVWFDSEEGKGSIFYLQLPKSTTKRRTTKSNPSSKAV